MPAVYGIWCVWIWARVTHCRGLVNQDLLIFYYRAKQRLVQLFYDVVWVPISYEAWVSWRNNSASIFYHLHGNGRDFKTNKLYVISWSSHIDDSYLKDVNCRLWFYSVRIDLCYVRATKFGKIWVMSYWCKELNRWELQNGSIFPRNGRTTFF